MKIKTKIICVIAIVLVLILLSVTIVNYSEIKLALRKIHLDIRDRFNEGQGAFWSICYGRAYWEIALDFDNLAVVRFVERIPHFSKDKRAEYVFEVVEWIKGGKGEISISVYSPYNSRTFSYSYMESLGKNYKYEPGKMYLIPLREYEDGYRNMHALDHYQPLYDEIYPKVYGQRWNTFWDMFVKVAYPDGVESLSREEFLNCIKSGYADPEAFKAAAMEIIQEEANASSDEKG